MKHKRKFSMLFVLLVFVAPMLMGNGNAQAQGTPPASVNLASAISNNPSHGASVIDVGNGHNPYTCTVIAVPNDAERRITRVENVGNGVDINHASKVATFPVLSSTVILSVTTNWYDRWHVSEEYGLTSEGTTLTVTGGTATFTTQSGISGSLTVCFGPVQEAPVGGRIGLGTPPPSEPAIVEYSDTAPYVYVADVANGGSHGQWDMYVSLVNDEGEPDSGVTSFSITPLAGTAAYVWVHGIRIGGCDGGVSGTTCTINMPENTTLSMFQGQNADVLVSVKWNETGAEPRVIGLNVPQPEPEEGEAEG